MAEGEKRAVSLAWGGVSKTTQTTGTGFGWLPASSLEPLHPLITGLSVTDH